MSFVTFLIFIRVADPDSADATTQVVVTVVDVNDNQPVFKNLPHSLLLPEVGERQKNRLHVVSTYLR